MITEEISVELIDHMGHDIDVVNAARVSFAKEVHLLSNKDERLIDYLARYNHWTPFAHVQLKFRCAAPMFLARQLVKHQVGLVWNEESRRYISSEPTFYVPQTLHNRPQNAKQGSGATLPLPECENALGMIYGASQGCLEMYNDLLKSGVAPEEARMVLPLNTMTHWIWTGSLVAFSRIYKLRADGHAQLAAQEFAKKLDKEMQKLNMYSWWVLNEYS